MAGSFFFKERAIVTLTSSGSSMTNGTAVSVGTDLDVRSAGNAAEDFIARFQLQCQWATITGIGANTVVADLYLLPKLDGTNLPDVDTSSGISNIPFAAWVGNFVATKAPTANTNMLFISPPIDLQPLLYTPYLLNRSGQTISANWTLKVVSAQGQYS
jgi:hypothetical protein